MTTTHVSDHWAKEVCRLYNIVYRPRQAKTRLRKCAKCTESDQPVIAQRLYWAFALYSWFCGIQWFYCQRIVKAKISLRKCASWSGPSLPAYARRNVFVLHVPYLLTFGCLHLSPGWYPFIAVWTEFFGRLSDPGSNRQPSCTQSIVMSARIRRLEMLK